jgi:hypothetical protein
MNKAVAQSPRGKKEAVTQWQGRSGPRTRVAKQKPSRSDYEQGGRSKPAGQKKTSTEWKAEHGRTQPPATQATKSLTQ